MKEPTLFVISQRPVWCNWMISQATVQFAPGYCMVLALPETSHWNQLNSWVLVLQPETWREKRSGVEWFIPVGWLKGHTTAGWNLRVPTKPSSRAKERWRIWADLFLRLLGDSFPWNRIIRGTPDTLQQKTNTWYDPNMGLIEIY